MTKLYTKEHEWLLIEGDVATVGITDHAQKALGDIVFVEVPEEGREVSAGDDAAVVESVKAASDVYAPIDGTITEGNAALDDEPGLVNASPEDEAWFFKMTIADASQLEDLMNAEDYAAFVASQED